MGCARELALRHCLCEADCSQLAVGMYSNLHVECAMGLAKELDALPQGTVHLGSACSSA
jgi:hypothetical protein